MRHALVEILREEELQDPALAGVSVTVTEVRISPDLKHALCFVEPLGGAHAPEVIDALNRASRFLRGRLGHAIDMRFTPALKFVHDESFDAAEHDEPPAGDDPAGPSRDSRHSPRDPSRCRTRRGSRGVRR